MLDSLTHDMARKRALLPLLPVALGCSLALPGQTAPTLASAKPPIYPLVSRATGHEGQVQLEMVLDTAGVVHSPTVVSGPEEFRQAAVQAVLQWHYHPYTNAQGQVQAVKVHVTVNFNMGNKKQKAAAMAKAQAELAEQAQHQTPAAAPIAPSQ